MTKKKTKAKQKKARPAKPVPKKVLRAPKTPAVVPSPSPQGRQENLRALLVARRKNVLRDLEEHLGKHLQGARPARENEVFDTGDQATQDVSVEMDLSFQERRTQHLKSIDEALQRLEDKTYGICDECGENIPEARLTALPFARFCVPCQEKQETLERIAMKEDRFK